MPKVEKTPSVSEISKMHIKVDSNKKWCFIPDGGKGPGHYLVQK